jgi:hypothetical protein
VKRNGRGRAPSRGETRRFDAGFSRHGFFPLLNVSKLRVVIARGVNPVLQFFGPQATKRVTLLVLALWSLARDAPMCEDDAL